MFKNYINSILSSGLQSIVIAKKNASKTNVALKGEHAVYKVSIEFLSEHDTLHLVTTIDIKFPRRYISTLKDAVLLINNRLLVGHFNLGFDTKGNTDLTYSVSQPFFKEYNTEVSTVSKFLDIVLNTLNSCYLCFEAVKKGELTDLEAIDLFMCEPLCKA